MKTLKIGDYRILMTYQVTQGWPVDASGTPDIDSAPVELRVTTFNDFPERWYSVVDADNWLVASFETLAEAIEHIKEEL